jgi:hypothetical protein
MTKTELLTTLKKQRGNYLGDGMPGHEIQVSDLVEQLQSFEIKSFNTLEYSRTSDNKVQCTAIMVDGTRMTFTDPFLRQWALNKIFEQDQTMITKRELK